MNIAIVGCGYIGQKRARYIGRNKLLATVDRDITKAEQLAQQYQDCISYADWQPVVERKDINLIIIATQHDSLAEIGLAAIKEGKHILIEKPAARKTSEIELFPKIAEKTGALIRVGFNHRYHPAMRKARELIDQNVLGELMFIRARYGHGGRLGYEKEWRANPNISGGGELIDQGVHLIDLARWFLGDFIEVQGMTDTFFWDMDVEDNGFLLLKTAKKQIAFLHASCTEWKNLFSFEIYGKKGKIDISGLGGSYGLERLTFHKMLPQMGVPETMVLDFPAEDNSWEIEFMEFLEDIYLHRQPAIGIYDAQQALKIVEEIYRLNCHDYCT